MSRITIAMAVGLVLGLTAAFGGFVEFLIVAASGAVGLVVGLAIEGRIDVLSLLGRTSERR